MEKYEILKNKIQQAQSLSKRNKNWRFRYLDIKDNYEFYSLKSLYNISLRDPDYRVREIAKDRFNLLNNFSIRSDFNNVVTIKLVVPSLCNSKCSFCFNKEQYIPNIDINNYLTNLDNSITIISNSISKFFPISLDITGGEPTLNIDLFKKIIYTVKNNKNINKFCRITLTTNGYNLEDVINDISGIIKYVNISTHNYDYQLRCKSFGTIETFKDKDYKNLVLKLLYNNIDTSTISVLSDEIVDFKNYVKNYIKWCKNIGFVSLRFRKNVYKDDLYFEKYKQEIINYYTIINEEKNTDSNWCRLIDKDGFFIYFLNGVINTKEFSRGIEYIIHTDGLLYLDYDKKESFANNIYPVDKIFDLKK